VGCGVALNAAITALWRASWGIWLGGVWVLGGSEREREGWMDCMRGKRKGGEEGGGGEEAERQRERQREARVGGVGCVVRWVRWVQAVLLGI
jgi:hypothetical protein